MHCKKTQTLKSVQLATTSTTSQFWKTTC